ncbi:MAG: hypothetical protein HYZ29_11945 [Myxococcales bacterium]|nr:hypothetical protein [Myxococcales bacterium]
MFLGELVISRLPWASAAEAESLLVGRDRQELRALRSLTLEASAPGVLDRISHALSRLVRAPLAVVAAGDPVTATRSVGVTRSDVASDDQLWSRVHARRAYDPTRPDPFANRPVNTATLANEFPERADGFADIWRPLGMLYQLRTVVHDQGGFSGYAGVYRAARQGGFSLLDHCRMAAALPHIGDVMTVTRAMRGGNGRGLVAALDAFDQSAFLLLGQSVVHANRAARERHPTAPEWLRHPEHRTTQASITRVDLDGRSYELAIPRAELADPSPLAALPPALRRVAELMADGWSDKEIAAMTGYTHSSARTLATRVLGRLGLTGRGELVRRVRGR